MKNLAGLMDRTVRLESKATSKQPNGETAKGWVLLWRGWAAKKDETGSETADGKQILATGKTTWTLRYQNGITPMLRLVDESNGAESEVTYNITVVAEVGRKEALQLTTERQNV